MQTSKSLLVGCAAVICILTQTVRAADTDAQVKAREALHSKMNELQGQPASLDTTPQQAAPAPAPQKKKKTPPVASEKQKPAKPAPVAKPAPTETAMPEVVAAPPPDSEATARQRDAVRKKMDELATHEPVPAAPNQAPPVMTEKPRPTTSPRPVPPQVQTRPVRPKPTPPMEEPAKVVPSAVPTAPAPVATQSAPATPTPQVQHPPAVAPSTAPTAAAPVAAQPAPARQQPASQFQEPPPTYKPSSTASNERIQAEQAATEQAAMKPKAEKKQKKATRQAQTFQPMVGPELNISADKQQRLNDLLRRYQADEITPTQYHEERAKILGAQ